MEFLSAAALTTWSPMVLPSGISSILGLKFPDWIKSQSLPLFVAFQCSTMWLISQFAYPSPSSTKSRTSKLWKSLPSNSFQRVVFHFPKEKVRSLKSKANAEISTVGNDITISSLQEVMAHFCGGAASTCSRLLEACGGKVA